MLIKWRPVYLTPPSGVGPWEGYAIIPYGKFICWLVSMATENLVGFVVYGL
jgi:hypothetical protein